MKKSFSASVNGEFDLALSEEDAIPFRKLKDDLIHGWSGNESVNAHLIDSDFLNREYSFRINGTRYDISIKNELQLLIDELGLTTAATSVSNELKAPIPGLIVDVIVAPGAVVKAGDGLLVLEAMKMENKLLAAQDGVVKSVSVKKGDTVDKGTILIEFENDEKHT